MQGHKAAVLTRDVPLLAGSPGLMLASTRHSGRWLVVNTYTHTQLSSKVQSQGAVRRDNNRNVEDNNRNNRIKMPIMHRA